MQKNSAMAKPIAACESHKDSGKQSSAAELSSSEINAVMQLIQLSSADSYSDQTDHKADDSSNICSFFSFGKVDAASSASSFSSSASASVAERLMEAGTDREEDGGGDDDGGNFGGRRNKRYRSVVELYRVTNETVLMSVVKRRKKNEMKCAYQGINMD